MYIHQRDVIFVSIPRFWGSEETIPNTYNGL